MYNGCKQTSTVQQAWYKYVRSVPSIVASDTINTTTTADTDIILRLIWLTISRDFNKRMCWVPVTASHIASGMDRNEYEKKSKKLRLGHCLDSAFCSTYLQKKRKNHR